MSKKKLVDREMAMQMTLNLVEAALATEIDFKVSFI